MGHSGTYLVVSQSVSANMHAPSSESDHATCDDDNIAHLGNLEYLLKGHVWFHFDGDFCPCDSKQRREPRSARPTLALIVDDQVQLWFDIVGVCVLGHGANGQENKSCARSARKINACKDYGRYIM